MKRLLLIVLLGAIASINSAYAQNPFVRHVYTADPSARSYNGKMYVLTSRDVTDCTGNQGINGFCMPGYNMFSSSDLVNWTDHGKVVDQVDVPWGDPNKYGMWAPDWIEKNGKYYMYFPNNTPNGRPWKAIGVAIANKPEGPWVVQPNYIRGVTGIDPAVFKDSNGDVYLLWGSGEKMYIAKLKANMKELDGRAKVIDYMPSGYKEGSYLAKANGKYYYSFAHVGSSGYEIAYAMGNSPTGPFTYKGTIMPNIANGTNHASMVKHKNQWYLFYHYWSISGNKKLRSVRAEKLYFNTNGTIKTCTHSLRGIGTPKASEKIQIDSYSSKSSAGVGRGKMPTSQEVGWYVELSNNAWVKFNDVDFKTTYKQLVVRHSSSNAQGKLELRLGSSNGTLIAAVNLPSTGSLGSYKTTSFGVNVAQTGIKNIVAVLKTNTGTKARIDWLKFEGDRVSTVEPYSKVEAEGYSSQSGTKNATTSTGGTAVAYIENGDYIAFDKVNFSSGTMSVDFSVATKTTGGKINLILDRLSNSPVATVSVTNTGGWDEWKTVSKQIKNIVGEHKVFIQFTGAAGYLMNLDWLRFDKYVVPQLPYPSGPHVIPGLIESENFDNGGAGIAYEDSDSENRSRKGRTTEGVDLQVCAEGGLNVCWTADNEWLEYTVNVESAGTYELAVRYASESKNGIVIISAENSSTGNINLPASGGWQTYKTVTQEIDLVAGVQVVRLDIVKAGFNLNYIELNKLSRASQQPYPSGAHAIPGIIEAENFDNGGAGVAYKDFTPENHGEKGRVREGADIEACIEGGLNIGWTVDDEWLEYTVNVESAGTYELAVRYASKNKSGVLNVSAKNSSTGNISLPATGGWQTYKTLTKAIDLSAGRQVVRVNIIKAGFNLNYIEFKKAVGKISGLNKKTVGETISESEILVYPNPFNSILNIIVGSEYAFSKVVVYNTSGSVMFEKTINDSDLESISLTLDKLKAGIYMLQLKGNDVERTFRVIKE